MRVSPISVRNNPVNFNGKSKNECGIKMELPEGKGDSVTFTMPRNVALKAMPYLFALSTLVAVNGCSKSDPVGPVDHTEQTDSTAVPVSPAGIKLIDMWKGLGINIAGLGKIGSTSDVKNIKTISYYDEFMQATIESTLDPKHSTKDTTAFIEKQTSGNLSCYSFTKYSLDKDGNLICKSSAPFSYPNPEDWGPDAGTGKYVVKSNGNVDVILNGEPAYTLSPDTPTSVILTSIYNDVVKIRDIIIK